MGIPDPVLNCILAVCCPPERAEAALGKSLVAAECCDEAAAEKVSAHIFEYFDLMPKGSTTVLKAEIARLARDNRSAG